MCFITSKSIIKNILFNQISLPVKKRIIQTWLTTEKGEVFFESDSIEYIRKGFDIINLIKEYHTLNEALNRMEEEYGIINLSGDIIQKYSIFIKEKEQNIILDIYLIRINLSKIEKTLIKNKAKGVFIDIKTFEKLISGKRIYQKNSYKKLRDLLFKKYILKA